MRSLTAVVVAAVVVALAVPAAAAAQEPVTSFDQLNTRLKPGDTIWITDTQGREVKGKIQALAPDALTLTGGGPRTFAASDVSIIRESDDDSLKNGALIGLGVGAGIGVAACVSFAAIEDGDAAWCAISLGLYSAMGAGVGVGIDALIPARKRVAYRAPGAPGTAPARLSFAPVITPRTKGVAVSFAF
jgi:hypothetical protein